MTRASLQFSPLIAALAVVALAGPGAAQTAVLGGSGQPPVVVYPGAAIGYGGGYDGGLLYPNQDPADGQVIQLRPPGGPPPAKGTAPATAAVAAPPPRLTAPPVPAPAASLPMRPAPTAPAQAMRPAAPAPRPMPAPAAARPAPAPPAPAPSGPVAMRPSDEGPTFQIPFPPGDSELSDSAKSQIGQLAARLKSEGGRLQLKAFASTAGGSASQARRTSLSRALAVRAFFIQEGLRGSVIDVRALGVPDDGGPEDRVDVIVLER